MNASTSLYKMPADIVRMILRASQDLHHDDGEDRLEEEENDIDIDTIDLVYDEGYFTREARKPQLMVLPSPDWINLMNSSSWMRSIALQTPRLWTTINFTDIRWATAYLERSGDMSLSCFLPHISSTELFSLLVANLSRVREIELRTVEADFPLTDALVQLCDNLLNDELINLEGLLIPACSMELMTTNSYNKLTVLHIDGGQFCPSSEDLPYPDIPTLKTLILDGFEPLGGIPMFIDFLHGFQGLQDLILKGMNRLEGHHDIMEAMWEYGGPDVERRYIKLPCLRSLKIQTNLRLSGIFMHLLSDSLPSRRLFIEITETEWSESENSENNTDRDVACEREIVDQARAFWKAVSGLELFPCGRIKCTMYPRSMLNNQHVVTWWGEHEASNASVYIHTPVDLRLSASMHDCTTLQLELPLPTEKIREPHGNDGSPVWKNLKKVVIYKAKEDDDFFGVSLVALQVWLVGLKQSNRCPQSIHFHNFQSGRERKNQVARMFGDLGLDVTWSSSSVSHQAELA
jgi:hypothetical protein